MRFKKILNKITDLFFPRRCTICDRVIPDDSGICKVCKKKTRLLRDPVCLRCGKKLKEERVYCYDCTRREHWFERNFAIFEYPVIRESLYRFKYRGRAEYAAFYAKAAYALHVDRFKELQADALIPVPLHKTRFRKRGYNQAAELAKELSKLTGIPVCEDYIKRVKATKALKILDVRERQNNLKKAFLIMQNDVKLNTIIVVDDIYTTGATLDAVAKVCKEADVVSVYSLTVAVGNGL